MRSPASARRRSQRLKATLRPLRPYPCGTHCTTRCRGGAHSSSAASTFCSEADEKSPSAGRTKTLGDSVPCRGRPDVHFVTLGRGSLRDHARVFADAAHDRRILGGDDVQRRHHEPPQRARSRRTGSAGAARHEAAYASRQRSTTCSHRKRSSTRWRPARPIVSAAARSARTTSMACASAPRIAWWNDEAVLQVNHHLGHARHLGADDGTATRHRFEQGLAEQLGDLRRPAVGRRVNAWQDHAGGAAVLIDERRVIRIVNEGHLLAARELLERLQVCRIHRLTDDAEWDGGSDRVDQVVNPLVRQNAADEEHGVPSGTTRTESCPYRRRRISTRADEDPA